MRICQSTRCDACPGDRPMVPGDGPAPCRTMFIGEAPGQHEDATGRPFVGKAGADFNGVFLPRAGLSRSGIYITNTVKCRPEDNATPEPEHAMTCALHHLTHEIEAVDPEVVILMGGVASGLFGYDLDHWHGIDNVHDRTGQIDDLMQGRTVVPVFHPAAGLHQPDRYYDNLLNDFTALRQVLHGKSQRVSFDGKLDLKLAANIRDLPYLSNVSELAIDTEFDEDLRIDDPANGWCLTFSHAPGIGRMIRSSDKAVMDEFRRRLQDWRGKYVLHNKMADWPICKYSFDISIPLSADRLYDTMSAAYRLSGAMSMGLKTLAFRLLGLEMSDYADVVVPYGRAAAREYFLLAANYQFPKPPAQWLETPDGDMKKKQPQGLSTKIKRLNTDFRKNDNLDCYSRLKKWSASEMALLSYVMDGPPPKPHIRLVPIDEAVDYACKDAVATLLLKPELEAMEAEVTI